jgi:hypothetical protein
VLAGARDKASDLQRLLLLYSPLHSFEAPKYSEEWEASLW